MSTPIAWGDPFRVNTTTTRIQFDPDLAGLANGGFIGVWTDNSRTGADGSGSAVRGQIFDAFGDKAGAEFLVNTSTKAEQTNACVAALANGRTVVVWDDFVDPAGPARGYIRGQIFNADGTKSGQEFIVLTSRDYNTLIEKGTVEYSIKNVFALPNGGFAVFSHAEDTIYDPEIGGTYGGVKIVFFSADGTRVASVEPGSGSQMAVLRNGRVVLVDDFSGDVHSLLRIYSANGTLLSDAYITLADTGVSRHMAQICPLATSGKFIAIWTEDDAAPGQDIVGQLFSNTGDKIGGEFQIADLPNDPSGIQAAALRDGNIITIWLDSGNVMGQLLNADGSKSGDVFTIHDLGLAIRATVSVLADGRFVVSWDNSSEVFAQIYDPRLAAIYLHGTAKNDSFVGSDFDDTIWGSFGRDSISGGAGNDHLYGEDGNDRLYGLDGNDVIVADEGHDLLRGVRGNDALYGQSGNDTIEGGAGNDTMRGSYGNDSYVVQSVDDVVIEYADQGTDTVRTSVDYSLGLHVENLTLLGTDDLVAEGNRRDNIIKGNDGDNDIVGGDGKDVLVGGKGRDDFIFESLADSGTGLARDVIKDFSEGIDEIDLSLIDAVRTTVGDGAFVFIGAKSFSGVAGQLRVSTVDLAGTASDKTIVAGDVDGNKSADFQIELSGLHKLDAGDFVL